MVFHTLSSLLEFVVITFDPAQSAHWWVLVLFFCNTTLTLLRLLPIHVTFIFWAFDCHWVWGRGIGWFKTCCWISVSSLLLGFLSTSMMDGIGVFDRVTHWWICLVALTTLGDVVSFDVEAVLATMSFQSIKWHVLMTCRNTTHTTQMTCCRHIERCVFARACWRQGLGHVSWYPEECHLWTTSGNCVWHAQKVRSSIPGPDFSASSLFSQVRRLF